MCSLSEEVQCSFKVRNLYCIATKLQDERTAEASCSVINYPNSIQYIVILRSTKSHSHKQEVLRSLAPLNNFQYV